MKVRLL